RPGRRDGSRERRAAAARSSRPFPIQACVLPKACPPPVRLGVQLSRQLSPMKEYLRFAVVLLVLLFCVGCDQAVKAIAKGALAFSPPVLFLNGAVRLQYTEER